MLVIVAFVTTFQLRSSEIEKKNAEKTKKPLFTGLRDGGG
jgi:hypothetical protein